jgi:hypothetical protein
MTAAEKLASDPRVTAGARIAMFITPILVSIGLFVVGTWLTGQSAQMDAITNRVAATERAGATNDKRISVIESANVRTEKYQDETLARLDRMQDSIVQLSNTVAALTATIKAQEGRR